MLYYGLEQHSLDSYFQFKKLGSAPSTPTTNEIRLYAKDDGSGTTTLCYKNDAGTEICLPSSGTIVTGTGVSGRLAFWNGTSILTSDADLTFATDTLTATKIIAPTSITISTMTAGSLVFAGASGLLSQDNSNLFWDDTNNRLGLGTAAPGFQFHGVAPDASSFNLTIDTYGTGAVPNYRGRASRGTLASPSALSTDDLIIAISGLPRGTTAFASGARVAVQGFAAEAQTDTAQGTYLTFRTTPTGGSVTMAERFRVGPAGQWGIGGATFGTTGNLFKSGGASAAPSWQDHTADFLTQYALLAGRAGGQTLIGGTASGDDLTLKSTSNATKGSVQVTDSEFLVGNGASPTAALNASSIASVSSFPGGDWIAWFRRESSANPCESIIRHEHFSGGAIQTLPIFAGIGVRGTKATPTLVTTGDGLLVLDGRGYDGSAVDYSQEAAGFTDTAAQIGFWAGSAWSSSNHESYITFSTVASGSTSPAEIARVNSSGLGIGVTPIFPVHITKQQDDLDGYPTLHIAPTVTGTHNSKSFLIIQGTHSPSASIALARGMFVFPTFNPAAATTLTDARVLEFTGITGNTGAITNLTGLLVGGPSYGTTVPTTVYGAKIDNQGAAGITTAIALSLTKPTAATNNYYMEFSAADNTDPTGGGGAATGRIAVSIAGTLRYIPYY